MVQTMVSLSFIHHINVGNNLISATFMKIYHRVDAVGLSTPEMVYLYC